MLLKYYDTDSYSKGYMDKRANAYTVLPNVVSHPTLCPFCQCPLLIESNSELHKKIDLSVYFDRNSQVSLNGTLQLSSCLSCGWFHVFYDSVDYEGYGANKMGVINSIVKKFDISSTLAPVEELAKYLNTKIDDIRLIHHKKMEELVASVFREHFNCEVKHCGQSHDKGIDLLVVQGEELIPVQIKRRITPNKTESVSVVREMLGVMLRDQRKSAIVVSSANKFSNSAISEVNEVNEVKEKKLIERFDLVDLNTLHGIMQQYFGTVVLNPYDYIKDTFCQNKSN